VKRFRVDFSIRETDVAEGDEPLGIRFGDEIDIKDIFDFFNRCRDAAVTLFNGRSPKDERAELTKKLEAEVEKLRIKTAKQRMAMGAAAKPEQIDDPRDLMQIWSRGEIKKLF